MPSVLFIDTKLSLSRFHKNYPNTTYFSICKQLASGIFSSVCRLEEHEYCTVVKPHQKSCQLTKFTRDQQALDQILNDLDQPTGLWLHGNFCDILEWAGQEVVRYWSPSAYVKVFVVTDGHSSPFTQSPGPSSCSSNSQWRGCLTIFSLTNSDQLPANWTGVCDHFKARGRQTTLVSTSTATLLQSRRLPSTVQELVDCLLRSTVLPHDSRSKTLSTSRDTASQLAIRCGNHHTRLSLVPDLVVPQAWKHTPPQPVGLQQQMVTLEIFGFLNLDDLSNPPVSSRHCLVSRALESDKEAQFLGLLFTALQSTRTVAIGSLSVSPPPQAPGSHSSTDNPSACLFGFLHQLDMKNSTLLLSVFHENCKGLPWLGDFEYLAPVADFAGSQLYDGHSPFPVRLPDRLSYEADASAADRKEGMRYVSWTASGSMSADISKVMRLVRRLPDRAALLHKELQRIRSAAIAYGCPDLLTTLLSMIHQTQGYTPDQSAASSPLRLQMEKIAGILTASEVGGDQ